MFARIACGLLKHVGDWPWLPQPTTALPQGPALHHLIVGELAVGDAVSKRRTSPADQRSTSGSSVSPVSAPPPPDERPGIFSGGGGLGSFLRSVGTTAAGVAGGEMLFSGLSDLFGHHGGRMFGGGQGFMGGGENVTINNYGNDDDRQDDDRGYDAGNN